MAISSITTDYSTRKKDVHIFNGVNPYTTEKHPITPKFGKVSAYCAGVQKLIQRYAISFLTAAGSQEFFPDFGSSFMNKAKTGYRGITKADIQHMFNFGSAKVIIEFRAYQSKHSDDPLDEQLNGAVLTDCGVVGDKLFLNITLETLAGDNIPFVLPLPHNK